MNRREVANAIAANAQLSPAQAEAALQALSDVLMDAVAHGTPVRLPGLLTVETVQRAERAGRNPRTGESITIAARTAVRLTPGSMLTAAANR